jgi:hypothetical protein
LLDDRIACGGAIRAAGRATDRSGHVIVYRLDVEFVTCPARALDFNFHGQISCAKLNGVMKTSCRWIAIWISKSGPKYKRIFGSVLNSLPEQSPGSGLRAFIFAC